MRDPEIPPKLLFLLALGLLGTAPPLRLALAEEFHLRASQIGYLPDDVKIGIAFADAPGQRRFAVVETDSGRVAYEGDVRDLAGMSWGKFPYHAELDFSPLKRPGRYCLRVGKAASLPFRIGPEVYRELPDQLLEFMRQQRCGYNPWLDATCHPFDGRTAYGPEKAGTQIDARGGWHDAADLLKYLITSSNATAQMLLAWQLRTPGHSAQPQSPSPITKAFADQVDESGRPSPNGVPDVLDEARWGLEWMLKLHPAPDQLYHQVADDRDHCGFRLPQNERADYGWGKGGPRVVYFADGKPQGLKSYQSQSDGIANVAGRYAAAMALAYQVWKDDPQHAPFARRCLQAGVEVYRLGRAKEGVQQGNSCLAPYRYEETTWADDMEWGAAELYRATSENHYLDDAKRYARLAASESWMGRTEARHYQYYPFMNAGHFRLYDLVDAEWKARLARYYREGIDRCIRAGEGNPYRVGVPFLWCSNNLVVALVTQCQFYERMTGDRRYHEFAARQRDWLVGRNPWGMTVFTGIGQRFPKDPHLMTTRLTGRPIRGGLVDGPVKRGIFSTLKGVSIAEPDPLAAFQDERAVYHDDLQDYSTNEPTMDGTASAILMWALAPAL